MGYVQKDKRQKYLIAGFVLMLMLGFFGDAMLLDRGSGPETAVNGLLNMDIGDVPLWRFMLSFFIGIPAALGYWIGTRSVWSYVEDRLNGEKSRALRAYKGATAVMALALFGQHTICTMGLMLLRAAVVSGVSAEAMTRNFTQPFLIPFAVGTLIQTAANAVEGAAFVVMICKRQLPVSKAWIILSPGVLYVVCTVLTALNNAILGSHALNMLFACSESWAFGFSFLCALSAAGRTQG